MKGLSLILTLLLMANLYSCGGTNSSGKAATSSSSTAPITNTTTATSAITPIVQNGMQGVLAGDFAGTWSGYLNSSNVTFVIAQNGLITATVFGSDPVTRILYLQNNAYYILDTTTKKQTPIRLSGGNLLVTSNGFDEVFIKY